MNLPLDLAVKPPITGVGSVAPVPEMTPGTPDTDCGFGVDTPGTGAGVGCGDGVGCGAGVGVWHTGILQQASFGSTTNRQ